MINFTQLYDKHVDNLFMFGSRFTSDRELIKDCIQDIFVRIFSKKDQLYKVGNIDSYLYAALRNRINDEYRRQVRLSDDEITDKNMRMLNEQDVKYDLEYMEEEKQRNMMMTQYLGKLSPRQQQIIHLFYIEQRKYDDICQIMGISYQSVRNLMHRSISRLREMAAESKAEKNWEISRNTIKKTDI